MAFFKVGVSWEAGDNRARGKGKKADSDKNRGTAQPVPDRIRRVVRVAVGSMIDPVMEVGNVVICDHMA
jgi:hypothetical protein